MFTAKALSFFIAVQEKDYSHEATKAQSWKKQSFLFVSSCLCGKFHSW